MALADQLNEEKLYPLLLMARDLIKAEIPGLKSCGIGIEANIVAEHYPLVRIVVSEIQPSQEGSALERASLLVYYGCAIYPADSSGDLAAVYRNLLNHDKQIKHVMRFKLRNAARQGQWPGLQVEYLGTYFDEDRPVIPHYKLVAGRFLLSC